MEIALWYCQICTVEFNPTEGGICKRCGKPTCDEHLRIVNYNEKDGAAKAEQIVCIKCIANGERSVRFEQRLLNDNLLGRLLGR